jgi:pimeloyl-ACP methyl ester carboxylesterase
MVLMRAKIGHVPDARKSPSEYPQKCAAFFVCILKILIFDDQNTKPPNMSHLKFKFAGTSLGVPPQTAAATARTLPTVEVTEYEVMTRRSSDEPLIEIDAQVDDVFEFVMDDDSQWFVRAEDLADNLRRSDQARGIETDPKVIVIPAQFETQTGTRNLLTEAAKHKLMRFYTNWAKREAAVVIAGMMESKLRTGLHRLGKDFELLELPDFTDRPSEPYLLLLHGTGSDVVGAFKSFAARDSSVWDKIYDAYDGRVLAFEHKTWSESPLKNTRDLLESLPEGITLDIISHSRGGLIGEILARFSEDVELSEKLQKAFSDEVQLLGELGEVQQLIKAKKPKVGKFVRVACPTGGTALMGKRLDVWLNVMLNSLLLIPGVSGNPVYEFLSDFIKAVVHERLDAKTLPGLASMMPGSPLVKLLNQSEKKLGSSLYVISGDARTGKLFGKLMVLVGDLFFREEHDLVVPVNSMRIGVPRLEPVWEYFSTEEVVNHFRYFQNPGSRRAIHTALTAQHLLEDDFRTIWPSVHMTRKLKTVPVYQPGRPTVFLLPGIMGTHLRRDQLRIWVHYMELAAGGLYDLKIQDENIHPDGLHDPSYADLAEFLSRKDYNVVPWGFDWRNDLLQSAKQLRDDIWKYLDKEDSQKSKAPVSFIAHSMGGLLLRTTFAKYPDLYKRLAGRPHFRVLLLGVPLEGSWAIARVLAGRDRLIQKVALLDLIHSKRELLSVISQYPGLLQLLPRNDRNIQQFFDYWKQNPDEYPPLPGNAPKYLEDLKKLPEGPSWDPQVFKYIAGKDDQTPDDILIEGGKLQVRATPEGDGRVPWATIPKALEEATYFVPVSHGDIPDHQPAFEAFAELLEKGATDLLSRRKPVSRSAAVETWMPEEDVVEYPASIDIDDVIGGRKSRTSTAPTAATVQVSLTHGDLSYSRHPLIAGHFKGDAILYAESVIDKHLGYKLSMRYELGYYAEEIGQNIILIPQKEGFKGGIVIGLGNFGELTASKLKTSLHSALVNYLLKLSEESPANADRREVGISTLLIGSGFGSLLIGDCVKAVFDAVLEVNKQARSQNSDKLPLIRHVEIVELYRYKVVQCLRFIRHLSHDSRYSAFQLSEQPVRSVAGRRDRVPDEINSEWWHRIKISLADNGNPDGAARFNRPIVFTSITDRSRAEEKILDTNRVIVDELVQEAARYTGANPGLSKALFELLVPNEFKNYTSELRNMVLIVDKETARYPWELMTGAGRGEEQPIAVKAGLLRQLSTSNFRLQVESAGGDKVLVIGDPLLEGVYPQLPGARQEAENVADLLQRQGYVVKAHIGSKPMHAVIDLLSQPFQIMHFAAHGIANDPHTGQTGIVLGPNTILTPSVFKQMRYVPDIVFVNCCSLGQIKPEQEKYLQAKYEVAASVGCQLIEMGVRAVIVAGWEVEDVAARHFSELLYQQLLAGTAFGKAVSNARATIFNEHPGNNTWGAYQCYGDPFYVLKKIRKDNAQSKSNLADAEEAVTELSNFLNGIDVAGMRAANKEALLKKVREWENTVEKFYSDGRVTELIADAYAKAGDLKTAVVRYERLFQLEVANYSVRALEQCLNLRARLLSEQTDPQAGDVNREEIVSKVNGYIQEIEVINRIHPTSERLSLIGSAYKRAFLMLRSPDYLKKTEKAYFDSLQYYQTNPGSSPNMYYPFFNWATAYALLEVAGHKPSKRKQPSAADVERALAEAMGLDARKPDFWNKTAPSMGYAYQLIKASEPAEIERLIEQLADNFREAWVKEGNESNRKSHLDQFRFIIHALSLVKDKEAVAAKIAAFEAAIARIEVIH